MSEHTPDAGAPTPTPTKPPRKRRGTAPVSPKPALRPTKDQLAARVVELELLVRELSALRSMESSSVKLTRNSRGETQVEVKVGTGERDVNTAEEAAHKARAIYDDLITAYGLRPPAPEPEPARPPYRGRRR